MHCGLTYDGVKSMFKHEGLGPVLKDFEEEALATMEARLLVAIEAGNVDALLFWLDARWKPIWGARNRTRTSAQCRRSRMVRSKGSPAGSVQKD